MKLATKLITPLVGTLVVATGVNTLLRMEREVEVFADDMRRDHQLVARTLTPSLVEAFRVGGAPAVGELLTQSVVSDRLRMRWLEGPPVTEGTSAGSGWRAHAFQIPSKAPAVGWLEVSERTDMEQSYLRAMLRRTLSSSVILAVIASLAVAAIAVRFVIRPVRLLRARARRMGAGDFAGSLLLRQRDEIGDLARDMDQLSDDLAAAKQRAAEESEARIHALEQVRQADRLASVGKLASGMAHELGTPLGIVLARARLIEGHDGISPDVRKSAAVVASQVERMSDIIRQLLDFARSGHTARQSRPGYAAVDLQALAHVVATLLEPLARKRSVNILVEDGTPARALGDEARLQQVLLNLVLNAVQAMQSAGQVRVGVAAVERAPVDAPDQPARSFLCVRVSDQGPGIAPENIAHVFDPFFTTKDVGEGTGLGLAVALGIVQDHDGWIEVTSTQGAGACFMVFLPVAQDRRTR